MKSDKVIHMALTFDENYIVPFYVVLTSLFLNNQSCVFKIHVIATGLSVVEKNELMVFVNSKKSDIIFYDIDSKEINAFRLPTTYHFALANYYRLFLPNLIPDYVEKVLYIDTDVVINGDISGLYNIDLGKKPVAAAVDTAFLVYEHMSIPQGLGILDKNKYFNSGVLLINLIEWRAQRISENALDFIKLFPERITFVDQDALNAVLIDNWLRLDKKFNLMHADVPYASSRALKAFVKDKVIIHFTGPKKPWHYECHSRLRHLYFYYLKKSPKANQSRSYDFKAMNTVLKIRFRELYFELPIINRIWKTAKKIF